MNYCSHEPLVDSLSFGIDDVVAECRKCHEPIRRWSEERIGGDGRKHYAVWVRL